MPSHSLLSQQMSILTLLKQGSQYSASLNYACCDRYQFVKFIRNMQFVVYICILLRNILHQSLTPTLKRLSNYSDCVFCFFSFTDGRSQKSEIEKTKLDVIFEKEILEYIPYNISLHHRLQLAINQFISSKIM